MMPPLNACALARCWHNAAYDPRRFAKPTINHGKGPPKGSPFFRASGQAAPYNALARIPLAVCATRPAKRPTACGRSPCDGRAASAGSRSSRLRERHPSRSPCRAAAWTTRARSSPPNRPALTRRRYRSAHSQPRRSISRTSYRRSTHPSHTDSLPRPYPRHACA